MSKNTEGVKRKKTMSSPIKETPNLRVEFNNEYRISNEISKAEQVEYAFNAGVQKIGIMITSIGGPIRTARPLELKKELMKCCTTNTDISEITRIGEGRILIWTVSKECAKALLNLKNLASQRITVEIMLSSCTSTIVIRNVPTDIALSEIGEELSESSQPWITMERFSKATTVPGERQPLPIIKVSLFTNEKVEMYTFADDIYVITSGWTFTEAMENMKDAVQQIEGWCNDHNMVISTTKSNIMDCSRKKEGVLETLTIKNEIIPWIDKTKILGVIFTANLKWNKHLESKISQCGLFAQIINLLTTKGSGIPTKYAIGLIKQILIPTLTYGSMIMGDATKKSIKKIQTLVNQLIRKALGVPRSCPIPILWREGGLISLTDIINIQGTRYVIRRMSITSNTVWSNQMSRMFCCEDGGYEFFPPVKRILKFVEDIQLPKNPLLQITDEFQELPQWVHIITDLFPFEKALLTNYIVKCIFQGFQESIEEDAKIIYTDAAKTESKCGIGIYYQNENIKISQAVNPDLSIFSAEILAVAKAIQKFCQESNSYYVFMDNLSALQALQNANRKSHTMIQLLIQFMYKYQCKSIKLIWIPSHMEIPNNELADHLATQALLLNSVGKLKFIPMEDQLRILNNCVEKYIEKRWKLTKYAQNFSYMPILSQQVFLQLPRSVEKMIHRLRTNTAPLNSYLQRIRAIDSPRCSECGVPETVQHYLLDCKKYQQQRNLAFLQVQDLSMYKILHESYTTQDGVRSLANFIMSSKRFD